MNATSQKPETRYDNTTHADYCSNTRNPPHSTEDEVYAPGCNPLAPPFTPLRMTDVTEQDGDARLQNENNARDDHAHYDNIANNDKNTARRNPGNTHGQYHSELKMTQDNVTTGHSPRCDLQYESDSDYDIEAQTFQVLAGLTEPPDKNIVKASVHGRLHPPAIRHVVSPKTAQLYKKVTKVHGYNANGPKVMVISSLNIEEWLAHTTEHEDDEMVLNGIMYGFPLQYADSEPPHMEPNKVNHGTAKAFPVQVDAYFDKELAEGAISGPYDTPPFEQWFHVSPIMTREKAEPGDRRIIVDLSYPEGGVNAAIAKNSFNGAHVQHNLPTVKNAVDMIIGMNSHQTTIATIDIARAYRNFRTDPRDWPLLGMLHNDRYYFDMALPFGARMSSLYMQKIAQFITRALDKKGITALIYLDDLLIISEEPNIAERHFEEVNNLITLLGLPIAAHKSQSPTRSLVWLGINIDIDAALLTIPDHKLEQIKHKLNSVHDKQYITVKQTQSIVGSINHLSKAINPARMFMGRILSALSNQCDGVVTVDHHMRRDLEWFDKFMYGFNGKSMFTDSAPVKDIYADACGTGFGAHDDKRAYSLMIPVKMQRYSSTQLECINCLLAIVTFIDDTYSGKTIRVNCDNAPTIFAYSAGKARDAILAGCARAAWYHAARLNINITYRHIPGIEMIIPDALSRRHLSVNFDNIVSQALVKNNLYLCTPSLNKMNYSSFV